MTDFTNTRRLNGLIAATYTPLHRDGRVHLDQVGPVVDHVWGVDARLRSGGNVSTWMSRFT